MGINLVTFAAQTVTPQDDALIYETALQESGMIYGGAVTIKSANVLHIAAGHGALCGRKFTIEETDVAVGLTPSGSLLGRIYIHMDLSDTGEPISFQTETANSLTPVIQQSDVNINNGVYEINLATFTVDTSTISNLVNVAPFIDISPDSEFSASSNNPLMNKAITKAIGNPETIGGIASKPYTKGALLLATDGQIYEVTQNIALNGSIVNGGNVSPTGNIISQISKFANHQDITASLTIYDVYAQNVAVNDLSVIRCGNIIMLSLNISLYQAFAHNVLLFRIKNFPSYIKLPLSFTVPICSVSNGKVIGNARIAFSDNMMAFYTSGATEIGGQYNRISAIAICADR